MYCVEFKKNNLFMKKYANKHTFFHRTNIKDLCLLKNTNIIRRIDLYMEEGYGEKEDR